MRVFTGIVPPEEIYNKIVDIQSGFGDNRLEPHVTITPPATVIDSEGWLKSIEAVCNSFAPFEVLLPATGQFGKRVLFIDIDSKGLQKIEGILKTTLTPFEKDNKEEEMNRKYNPHMTLGRKWCGFSKEDFVQMKILAEEFLKADTRSFTVSFIRAYHKPSPGGRYEKLQDFPLLG